MHLQFESTQVRNHSNTVKVNLQTGVFEHMFVIIKACRVEQGEESVGLVLI